MAKRVLLFVGFFIISLSLALGQCNRVYNVLINETYTASSEFGGRQNLDLDLCPGAKVSVRITNSDADVLKISWYRNDSLLTNNPVFETDIIGVYRAEIQTEKCLYKIGQITVGFSEKLYIVLSADELTVCENGASPISLYSTVIKSMTDISYQWQKDGEDMPGKNNYYINVNTPGIYTVRATAGACSATSAPTTVKANKDNLLTNSLNLSYEGPIKKDTIFICKDFPYKLISKYISDWYLNGKFITNGFEFTPTQSGTYTTSLDFGNNCMAKSEPVYVSIGTKISPIEFDFVSFDNLCNRKDIFFLNDSFKTPNKLQFYDFNTNNLLYSYSTPNGYFYTEVPNGKYKVELETGSCKSVPSELDLTKNLLPLQSAGKKVGGKKINLCSNSYTTIYVNYSYYEDDVSLYKDGVLVETKSKHDYNRTSGFKISSTGKYYIKTLNTSCSPDLEILSDTVEIIVGEPISTRLSLSEESCNAKTLIATPEKGVNYYWYKDKTIVPNATSSSFVLNKNESGTYYAVLQKGLCSVATQSITFGSKITGTTNLCEQARLVLASTIKNTPVSWKGPDNFSSNEPNISIDSIKTKQEGWYFLLTTTNGCTFKDSVYISVTKKPDVSFSFVGPTCIGQNLVVKFKASPGYYNLTYNLLGNEIGRQYFHISDNYAPDGEKYVNLGKVEAIRNEEYLTINLNASSCNFSLPIPAHAVNPELCNDAFEFTNIKEKYCFKEKATLKFKLPANIPKGKKFRITIENYLERYDLGYFSSDSIQLSIPVTTQKNLMYFIIENEDGKFMAISKEFSVKGQDIGIYALPLSIKGNTIIQCNGVPTQLKSKSNSTDKNQSLQWRRNGIDISGATLPDFEAKESGLYSVLLIDPNCTIESSPITIKAVALPTATIAGDTTLNIGDTANLKLSFTSSPPFTYKLSNNQEGTTDKNTITHPVKIEESTVFKLASIKNACGEGTVSGEAKINVIILGNEPLIGHKITIAPIPAESYCEIIFDLPVSQEVSYQLLNMKGQQLSEKNLGNITYKKQYLNLNHLTAGEYLIKIQVGKDFVTRKLIKF